MGTLVVEMDRERIVDAARESIEYARDSGYFVDTKLVRRLMRIARTAPRFALGTWFIKGECGCLIGNLFGEETHRRVKSGSALLVIGNQFDQVLKEELSDEEMEAYVDLIGPAIVRVRDEEPVAA